MNLESLLEQLSVFQGKVLDLCQASPEDFDIQYHPDLSPLGWHLGHCIYTEIFWIREQLLSMKFADQKLQTHYVPELAKKSERGQILPNHSELCQWARDRQKEDLELLNNHAAANNHHLMENHFLLHFLIQHYAQHFETMHMILMQRALQNTVDFEVKQTLTSHEINISTVDLKTGTYTIGAQTNFLPYDNEYPPHEFKTNEISISEKPVNNREYLLFMEEAGYQTQKYWSQAGWLWKEKHDVSCPAYWLKNNQQAWFSVDIGGAHELDGDKAVWGLNYYEAEAFANWISLHHRQARLLHEYEWEAAKQNNLLQNTGQVWEWCQNNFHPYQNPEQVFKAYPYAAYSTPYFDDTHFVMKGGSRYTQNAIQRSSFRNYYQADKRHQLAGCRLVLK